MKLMLIGVGFFPHIVAGDKNFFTRLIPLLARSCESIDIVSINDGSGSQQVEMNGCRITYHNVRRALHFGDTARFFSGFGTVLDYYHKHRSPQEIAEVLLTTARQLPMLRRLVRERGIRVVHFMDNMGPSMPLVRRALAGVVVTHSAMAYVPRGRWYNRYIKLAMGNLDRIVPYSCAYARKLVELGIDENRLEVIRWGVEPKDDELSSGRKAEVRATYDVPPHARLLLWSGFIQQIGEADFRAAVAVARRVAAARPECRFLFAFKPRSFREDFKELESESIRIETNIEHFAELLESADLMYSPMLRSDIIVAPPLTWLEAMSVGTPVITTAAGGVDEVVTPGTTGFVARSFDDLADTVIEAVDCRSLQEMGRNCRSFVSEHCNIREVAQRHVNLWRQCIGHA